MALFFVFSDEVELLRIMRPLDRDIFNYLIERMDYKTGVIGLSRKVSRGGIALDLSERDGERRRIETLSKVTMVNVRHSISRLVEAGLLRSFSKQGKGCNLILERVFYADFLGKGSFDQKPVVRQLSEQMSKDILKLLSIFNGLHENNKTSCPSNEEPVVRTSLHHQQQGDIEFVMSMDWQPTADEFEMMLFRAGYAIEKIDQLWINEFIDHWRVEGKRRHTQAEWTKRLAYKMIRYLREPGAFEKLHGINQQTKPTASPGKQGVPEWARLPREDEVLMSWAKQHGYCEAEPGWSYLQYRNVLRNKVENRLSQWRRLS